MTLKEFKRECEVYKEYEHYRFCVEALKSLALDCVTFVDRDSEENDFNVRIKKKYKINAQADNDLCQILRDTALKYYESLLKASERKMQYELVNIRKEEK